MNKQVVKLFDFLDSLALKAKEYPVGQFLKDLAGPGCKEIIHISLELGYSITY